MRPSALLSRWLSALGLIVSLGTAVGARASDLNEVLTENLSVSVTNTAVVEYRSDNENGDSTDDDYGVVLDRLNVSAQAGDLSTSVRLDTAGFVSPPIDAYESMVRLERANMAYRLGDWTLEVGDHYEQLGRGIALSTRKLDEAGVDVSIFGGRARYVGETHAFTLFGGRANSANVDAISQRVVRDRLDYLAGGAYEGTFELLKVGAYALYNQPQERLLDTVDLGVTAGGYVELPALVDWLIAYLEVAAKERYLAGALQTGLAGYLNTEVRFGDFAVFGEGLFLSAFEQNGSQNTALGNRFRYNRPPTLERLDQEVINNRDVIGGRVRAEYYFFDLNTLVYANVMTRLNDPFEASRLVQFHGFGGIEMSFDGGASRLALASGYRHEQQPDQERPVKTIIHVDVDYLQALGLGYSLHLTSNTWYRTFSDRNYFFGITIAGIEKAGLGGLSFELGYDTFDQSPGVRNLFYAGILSWEMTDELLLRAVVGNERGGLKCVAGVCREYPAFSGAQVTLITRF